MKQNKFPPGWDAERVQSVIDYYENQTEDEAVAEDEAGLQYESVTLMEIPTELVPIVGKPLVFVECKRWRDSIETEDPQDQIARYIFQEGVDLGVITNGREWDFYFAYKTHVPWKNRRFCTIKLDNSQETIANFQKYLSKSKVIDGSAKTEAEKIIAERTGIQWNPKPPEGTEDLRRGDA